MPLGTTLGLLRGRGARALAAGISAAYFLIAAAVAGMWQPGASAPSGGASWFEGSSGGFVVRGVWGTLNLPLVTSAVMALIALAVGLGMAAGLVLSWRVFRAVRSPSARESLLGPLASLTPAMVALLTLGACCSTVAAAAAGLGGSSGMVTIGSQLGNGWFLTVTQAVILAISLLAQDRVAQMFPRLSKSPASERTPSRVRSADRRSHPEPLPVSSYKLLFRLAVASWTGAFLLVVLPSPGSPGWTESLLEIPAARLPAVLALLGLSIIPIALLAWSSSDGLRGDLPTLRLALMMAGLTVVLGAPLSIPTGPPFVPRTRPSWASSGPWRGGEFGGLGGDIGPSDSPPSRPATRVGFDLASPPLGRLQRGPVLGPRWSSSTNARDPPRQAGSSFPEDCARRLYRRSLSSAFLNNQFLLTVVNSTGAGPVLKARTPHFPSLIGGSV